MSRGDGVLARHHHAIAATLTTQSYSSSALLQRYVVLAAISRQTPRHSVNGGAKKCDRPGSSEYSLCRFSATWRASLSGMNGSLSLWNWIILPAFALMASQRQGRA